MYSVVTIYFLRLLIYLFLDRGEGREKEKKRNITVWLPLAYPAPGNLACNSGVCPDWESNQEPFGWQAGAQSLRHTSQGFLKWDLAQLLQWKALQEHNTCMIECVPSWPLEGQHTLHV